MKSKIEKMLSIIITLFLMISQTNTIVFANETEISRTEVIEAGGDEIIETEDSAEKEVELIESIYEPTEDRQQFSQIYEEVEDNGQATIDDEAIIKEVSDECSPIEEVESDGFDEVIVVSQDNIHESTEQFIQGEEGDGETDALTPMDSFEENDCIVITEGSYSNYVATGETIWYSFTPAENGTYCFSAIDGGYDESIILWFYDSDKVCSFSTYGYQIRCSKSLEAGRTYYYEVGWENDCSGIISVTLGRIETINIILGNYTCYLSAGDVAYYSFTPTESGKYCFTCRAEDNVYAELYGSYNDYVAGEYNFSCLTANLEAGETYRYEVWLSDPNASGNISIELKRFQATMIDEGSYSNYLGNGDTIYYGFVPSESGIYYFHGQVDQYIVSDLYDSELEHLNSDYGIDGIFGLTAKLEAGKTYYYGVHWYGGGSSGNIVVTLEKRDAIVISEGSYSNYVGNGETLYYSFTPLENGKYHFHSQAEGCTKVKLYDAENNELIRIMEAEV